MVLAIHNPILCNEISIGYQTVKRKTRINLIIPNTVNFYLPSLNYSMPHKKTKPRSRIIITGAWFSNIFIHLHPASFSSLAHSILLHLRMASRDLQSDQAYKIGNLKSYQVHSV